MAPFNAFSRGWGERTGLITKDEQIDGLGDEAWLLRTKGNGTEVTYHWRRGNLVVEAHVHCFGICPEDVEGGARSWVEAIDEAARPGSLAARSSVEDEAPRSSVLSFDVMTF
jgi:hypothetical protein